MNQAVVRSKSTQSTTRQSLGEESSITKPSNSIIAIVGDWFIDENWLVSKHITYSSTHTGDAHFLSKHKNIDKRMLSLCGASEILEVLRIYLNKQGEKYDFYGFGTWNKDDNDILQCMLCPEHTILKYLTPYTLSSVRRINYRLKDGIRLCPYTSDDSDKQTACNYLPHLINLASGERLSTNRIVRRYEGIGSGKPILRDRVDWELPVLPSDLDKLDEAFDPLIGRDISAVVIEDHGKGVINEKTINKLIEVVLSGKDTKWYVRSKIDEPEWINILYDKGINIRLRLVDNKLAEHKKGLRRWYIGNEIGHAALELLGELTGDKQYKHGQELLPAREKHTTRAAVLFDDNTAIAKDRNDCYVLSHPPGPLQLINIGRTTTFFNALIAQDMAKKYRNKSFGIQCSNALRCAYEWSIQSTKAWSREDLHFYGDYSGALKSLESTNPKSEPNCIDYNDAWELWKQSAERSGIIGIASDRKYQLWRGEGALEGYITVGSPKRDAINDLIKKIDQFRNTKDVKYPFNCLLIAGPGWGKSFLAKSLAAHFNMPHLDFSISQMATSHDLIDCLDTICSVQNRSQEKLLIFMDEINCEIEGNTALGLLLNPIWDGKFIRNGKTYRLAPAVWIFASTATLDEITEPVKGSDFVSRLNGPIVELDALATEEGQTVMAPLNELRKKLVSARHFNAYNDDYYKMFMNLRGPFRTEQVYFAVSLLNRLWGPVASVQEEVLDLFPDVLAINGFRSLEFFISKFQNVTRSEVVCSNVPSITEFPEIKRHVVLPLKWIKERPEDNRNKLIAVEALPRRA